MENMSWPIPVHVAASGFDALVWLIVFMVWLVFQGMASMGRKKPPSPTERPPPEEEPPLRPSRDELRELLETITGQKVETTEAEEGEEEAPALPRPVPPPPVRKTVLPPPRPMVRAAVPPPVPAPASALPPPAEAHPVYAATTTTREALRLAPLMRMQWPRSPLFNLSITAATRAGQHSPLRRRLRGHAALRQAMVSRIVLGRPIGD